MIILDAPSFGDRPPLRREHVSANTKTRAGPQIVQRHLGLRDCSVIRGWPRVESARAIPTGSSSEECEKFQAQHAGLHTAVDESK